MPIATATAVSPAKATAVGERGPCCGRAVPEPFTMSQVQVVAAYAKGALSGRRSSGGSTMPRAGRPEKARVSRASCSRAQNRFLISISDAGLGAIEKSYAHLDLTRV